MSTSLQLALPLAIDACGIAAAEYEHLGQLANADCYRAARATLRSLEAVPELVAALRDLCATARTFRNVPKEQQEWTPLDDAALAKSGAA